MMSSNWNHSASYFYFLSFLSLNFNSQAELREILVLQFRGHCTRYWQSHPLLWHSCSWNNSPASGSTQTKKQTREWSLGLKQCLEVQEGARLKLEELTAVPKIQVKVLKLLPWFLLEFYFKCFFKWVGGVLALTTPSNRKLADLLSALVPPHRAVGGILYILPIFVALPSAAAWTAFVYCLTIAIREIEPKKLTEESRDTLLSPWI